MRRVERRQGQALSDAERRGQLNRARFIEFCRSLSEEELARPVPNSSYTVKDFVSHLGTLDPVLAQQFDRVAAGKMDELGKTEGGDPFDIDKFNDALVAERRDWTLDAILDEAAVNRTAFLESLAKLEDRQIEQVMHFTGDNKRDPADIPFKVFLHGLTRHDDFSHCLGSVAGESGR